VDSITIEVETVFTVGPLVFSISLLTCIALTFFLGALFALLTRHLQRLPNGVQVVLEGIVLALENAVKDVAGKYTERIMPLIASLWLFLVVANLLGLIPGFHTPTRDLSVTAALAMLVFFSVHWFGITSQGIGSYFRHYLKPSPLLLPFHIVSEITRTLALAVRLFGNMMSLELTALVVLALAGFLVPVPILLLHVIEALVQAYIFGMLALIYIAGGLQFREEASSNE
jgi:F-type H+-transporting ATPase subunit a